MDDRRDVWIAFVLSLAVPGAGQLWKRSASCVLWFAAGTLLLVLWGLVRENYRPIPPHWQVLSFLALGFASGLHASRVAARVAGKTGMHAGSDA
jgi:hypothetical protein